jgi:hypothetical protein
VFKPATNLSTKKETIRKCKILQLYELILSITRLHGSARNIVVGHASFKGEVQIFITPQSPHQSIDQHQTLHI